MKTFKQAVLDGEADIKDINDWVDGWHEDFKFKGDLAQYLGMSLSEYAWYVESPANLKKIIYGENK